MYLIYKGHLILLDKRIMNRIVVFVGVVFFLFSCGESETETKEIDDFMLEKQVLKVTFKDGSAYEYFGVPNKVYLKMINSATQYRFGKRHIFNSYTYRNIKKRSEVA